MGTKPMRWAMTAAERARRSGSTKTLAVRIQQAAEPLMAVVRKAIEASHCEYEGVIYQYCFHCAGRWPAGSSQEGQHMGHCPVPAALKAMEETNSYNRDS